MTLGTLEATEVVGKSKNDILDKMKLNIEIRNQLQIEGDNLARKYALKSARREKSKDQSTGFGKPGREGQVLVSEIPQFVDSGKGTHRPIGGKS